MKLDTLYSFLKSLTIVIPLAIGLIRFNKIDRSYLPFVIYLLVGFMTEVNTFIFFAFTPPRTSNAVISNSYALEEWMMILWLFSSWGFFKKNMKAFYGVEIVVIVVWIMENIVYGKLTRDFSPYFRVLYSFILVLMSVSIINYTIVNERGSIFRNARFLICLSFVIVFVYKLIYEWSYQYSNQEGLMAPRTIVIAAFGYVNAFQKLLCAVAALYIPGRTEFEVKQHS